MTQYVQVALPGLFVAALAVGVMAWLVAAVSMVQLPFNTRPDAIRGWLRLNPLNVILYADKLTPRGLAIRRRIFLALGVFASALLAGLATGAIAKLIAS